MEEVILSYGSKGTQDLEHLQASSMEMAQCKQATNRSLAKVIDEDEYFCFIRYLYTPSGIASSMLFNEINEEIGLIPRETCPRRAQALLPYGSNLYSDVSSSGERISLFIALRKFPIGVRSRSCRSIGDMSYSNTLVAENKFVGDCRVDIFAGLEFVFPGIGP